MAARLIVHHDFLHRVLKNPKLAIQEANVKQVSILVEIAHNLVNSRNIPLSDSEIQILAPIRPQLIELAKQGDAEDARHLLYKLSQKQSN